MDSENMARCLANRILIVGSSGAGKSWLGRRLASLRGETVTDLDDLYWLPNWQTRPAATFVASVDAVTQQPRWIICGNYRSQQELTWQRADLILWLDYSLPRCIWQASCRAVVDVWQRRSRCNGNVESWQRLFSRQSVLRWLLTTFYRRRRETAQWFARLPDHQRGLRFQHPRQTAAWLNPDAGIFPASHGTDRHPPHSC